MSSEEEFTFKETEIGSFPDDWEVMQLGDAAELIMGQSPPGNTYNEISDGIPFLQGKAEFGSINPKHIKYTTKPLKIAPEGTVLISVRAPVGDVNIADINYCIGRGLAALCLRDGENLFLFYILNFLKPEIEKEGTGSTFKAINKSKLQEFKIPLPPLPEQHRIAVVLSAVQDAKEKTGAVIAAAKSLKKSLMRHLFTYGPVPAGVAETVPLAETEIGLVPEGWEIFQTKDVCSLIIDCPHSTPKFTESGILVVRTSNVRDGKLVLNSPSFTSEVEYKERIKRGIPEEGDIIFTREAPIGEACLIPSDLKLCLGQRMMLLRPDKFLLNGYFLVQAFYSKQVREKMSVQGKGVTAKHLNVADVKRLLFPLPPLPIQQKIASILSTVDKKIEAEENKKKALDELFKSLLHNLMTAKIRVNHLEAIP